MCAKCDAIEAKAIVDARKHADRVRRRALRFPTPAYIADAKRTEREAVYAAGTVTPLPQPTHETPQVRM